MTLKIGDLCEWCAAQEPLLKPAWLMRTLPQKLLEFRRGAVNRTDTQVLTVIIPKSAISCLTKVHRFFQHRIEYRRKITRRGINDLQHLGCGGLLGEGFARLSQKPGVLHRNDRLRREVL